MVIPLLLLLMTGSLHADTSQPALPSIERIVITSTTATISYQPDAAGPLAIRYEDGVRIAIEPLATITADALDVIMHTSPQKSDSSPLASFEKITLTGNVHLVSNNRSAHADKAEILSNEKKCILQGNIRIEQTKQGAGDIPIRATTQELVVDLATLSCTLRGSQKKPVETTIIINEQPHSNTSSPRSTENSSRRSGRETSKHC